MRDSRSIRRARAWAATLVVSAALLAPEPSRASNKSLDAMSPAELERFVQQLNEDANWRKYRRPGDPPDFVPGAPVRVMHGAGAAFGRGGGRGGGSFRRSGLGSRRSGLGGRRRGREDAVASDRSRSSLGSSSRSRSGSSFGSSSRSSFGSSGRVEQGDMGLE
jgi:hypothetical protein